MQNFSTSDFNIPFPMTPQKINNKCSSNYFHILHVVERIALVWNHFKMLVGPQNIYVKCLWILLTLVYIFFRWPWDTFEVAGAEQSSLSLTLIFLEILTTFNVVTFIWVFFSEVYSVLEKKYGMSQNLCWIHEDRTICKNIYIYLI